MKIDRDITITRFDSPKEKSDVISAFTDLMAKAHVTYGDDVDDVYWNIFNLISSTAIKDD